MTTYPVRIERKYYTGPNAVSVRKRDDWNRVAKAVEAYINADLAVKEDGHHVYSSAMVAIETGCDRELVFDVISSIDAGATGVTIRKGPPS